MSVAISAKNLETAEDEKVKDGNAEMWRKELYRFLAQPCRSPHWAEVAPTIDIAPAHVTFPVGTFYTADWFECTRRLETALPIGSWSCSSFQ